MAERMPSAPIRAAPAIRRSSPEPDLDAVRSRLAAGDLAAGAQDAGAERFQHDLPQRRAMDRDRRSPNWAPTSRKPVHGTGIIALDLGASP
jgi:hypothetical protein